MPTLKLDGDATGAVRATSDVNAAAKKLVPTFKEIGDAAEKAGRSHTQSFGSSALRDLASYASGMLSVGAAIGFVTNALKEQNAEKQRASAADIAAGGAAGALSAAGGTAADLAYSRQLFSRGIVGSEEQGMQAVAGMMKAGLSGGQRDYMAKLADEMLVNPAAMGEYAQSVQAFRSAQGARAGTFEGSEAQLRTAARLTRFSPEEIALNATRLAGPGAEAGLSPEEQIATMIVIANKTRHLKTAGTQAEKMIAGGDRFTGTDATAYANALREVQGAGGAIGPSLVHTDQRLRAADAAADAAAAYQATVAERSSTATSLYNRLTTERKLGIQRRDGSGFLGAISKAAVELQAYGTQLTGTQENALEQAVSNRSARSFISDDLATDIREYLQRQTEIMERDDRSTPPPSGRQE